MARSTAQSMSPKFALGAEAESGEGAAFTAPRWVSLVPSLTETLFALGVGDQVVGATKFCVHPKEGMEHVQRVGGTKDPKIDAIVRLRPRLVFANQEENRREDVERLRAAGLEVHLSFPRAVADVAPMILDLAQVVGRREEGGRLAERLGEVVSKVSRARAGGPPVRFLVLIWRDPWMAATSDTFLSSLLETAGGVNVIEDSPDGRYPEVSLSEVDDWAPDVVLLPSEPYPFKANHVDELVTGTRIRPSRFVLCDGELLTWHGSRTAQGLLSASQWLTTSEG